MFVAPRTRSRSRAQRTPRRGALRWLWCFAPVSFAMLRPAATSATEPRQLVVDNLRQTVTSGSALASYLSTIYHQPLNSIQLAKVRLDQLQWMWNFAPISVECLYVRTSFSWQPSQVAPASSVCLQRGAQAGAVRVAPSYSLKLLDVYGYGLPFAMSSCPGAATINSHSRGAGATVVGTRCDCHTQADRTRTRAYRGWARRLLPRHGRVVLLPRQGGVSHSAACLATTREVWPLLRSQGAAA